MHTQIGVYIPVYALYYIPYREIGTATIHGRMARM